MFKNKKIAALLILIALVISAYIYSQKDIVTTYIGKTNVDSDIRTAILLNNGKVFITSITENKACKTTESYFDPNTNKFTKINERNVCDGIDSITVLPNDNILFAGGRRVNDALSTANIYNTKINKFIPTDNLKINRMGSQAILISNDKVLILGGIKTYSSQKFDYTEIYDIKSGTFHLSVKMPKNFESFGAELLRNNKVFILGRIIPKDKYNFSYLTKPDSFILYDIKSKKFFPCGKMNVARYGYSMTMLNNGNLLIAGGDKKATAEIYDYKKNKFVMTGSMIESRRGHTATLLRNGKILITGGAFGQAEMIDYRDTLELYDPKTGKFSLAGKMREKQAHQTAILLKNNKVLILGGNYGNKILNTVELY